MANLSQSKIKQLNSRPVNCGTEKCMLTTNLQSEPYVSIGYFKRKCTNSHVRRFKCKLCGKSFSRATHSAEKYQRIRWINSRVEVSICEGATLAAIARELKVDRRTIYRRIDSIAERVKVQPNTIKKNTPLTPQRFKEKREAIHLQFDEMQSSLNGYKMPVSIGLIVSTERRILAVDCTLIGSQDDLGLSGQQKMWTALFQQIEQKTELQQAPLIIHCDLKNGYRESIKSSLPNAQIEQHRSQKSRNYGFGELKLGFDPLFAINHTNAMHRDHLAFLKRSTWATCRTIERMRSRLQIYKEYHNKNLQKVLKTTSSKK